MYADDHPSRSARGKRAFICIAAIIESQIRRSCCPISDQRAFDLLPNRVIFRGEAFLGVACCEAPFSLDFTTDPTAIPLIILANRVTFGPDKTRVALNTPVELYLVADVEGTMMVL